MEQSGHGTCSDSAMCVRAEIRSGNALCRVCWAVVLLAVASGGKAAAGHDPGYEAINLGTLGGQHSVAFGITQNNEVVGAAQTADGRWHAFHWSEGRGMIDLGVLEGFDESFAHAGNESGQVVGRSASVDGLRMRAFGWSSGNQFDMGTLGGPGAVALGINAQGHAVGSAQIGSGAWRAFVRRNSQMIDLGVLEGHVHSGARAINNAGLIAGWSEDAQGRRVAAYWLEDQPVEIGTLGGEHAEAAAVSRNGIIVGFSDTGNEETHAFVWQNGQMSDLGTFPIGGDSRALSVNILREVVGEAYLSSVGEFQAVLWKPGRTITNINSLLPPFSEWNTLQSACGISDSGHVSGTGRLATGQTRAYLLKPKLGLANPIPGRAGVVNTFDATGATPFSMVHIVYGFQYGSVGVPICPGVSFGIRSPSLLRSVRADITGHAIFDLPVPGAARHRTVLFQAVEAGSCEISIITIWTFL